MTLELSNEDKKNVIEQHLKNVLFSEYNVELSLIEENAHSEKNQISIDSLNKQMLDIAAKKDALQSELDSVNAKILAANK